MLMLEHMIYLTNTKKDALGRANGENRHVYYLVHAFSSRQPLVGPYCSRFFGGDYFPDDGTEHVKEKRRRKAVRENQHIVDAFFNSRVEAFVEAFLKSSGMEAEYTWFRIEYQERGTAHAHGCFRLKCDPGIADLGQTVLQGRIAPLALHK